MAVHRSSCGVLLLLWWQGGTQRTTTTTVQRAEAFATSRHHRRRARRRSRRGVVDRDAEEALVSTDNGAASTRRRDAELWLDLRSTAITPAAASAHLRRDLEDDDEGRSILDASGGGGALVDRVLVPSEFRGDVDEALRVDADDRLVRVRARDEKAAAGRRLSNDANDNAAVLPGSSLLDPLVAMECLSRGGWVLVDPRREDDDDGAERSAAVANLMDFLADTVAASSSSTSLLLGVGNAEVLTPTTTEEIERIVNPYPAGEGTGGGVAVTCRNRRELLDAGVSFRSFRLSSSRSARPTVTEGGVLYVDDAAHDDQDESSTKLAVVLPLEPSLWRTAALLFGNEIEEEDYEDEREDRSSFSL